MSAMDLYTLYAVDVDSVLIDGITDQSVDPGTGNLILGADGKPYPTYAVGANVAPTIAFSTTAVATALAKVGTAGLALAAADAVTCYFQMLANGGLRAGASLHLKVLVSDGIIIPMTLAAAGDAPASIDYQVVATYDGTNAPLIVTPNQSLAGAPTVGELFFLGPVKINGTQVTGVQSIEVDFGISLVVRGSDGLLYPSFVAIAAIAPTIRITTTDVEALSTFGIDGTGQSATASEVYFRAGVDGGTRAANATSVHLKIATTASKGRISVQGVGGGEAAAVIIIQPTSSDGDTHPLTVTASTTIPAGL